MHSHHQTFIIFTPLTMTNIYIDMMAWVVCMIVHKQKPHSNRNVPLFIINLQYDIFTKLFHIHYAT